MILVELVPCRKPDCLRQVKKGSDYCCQPCAVAAAGAYEIDQHTAGCNERAAERGPYTEVPMPTRANVGVR